MSVSRVYLCDACGANISNANVRQRLSLAEDYVPLRDVSDLHQPPPEPLLKGQQLHFCDIACLTNWANAKERNR